MWSTGTCDISPTCLPGASSWTVSMGVRKDLGHAMVFPKQDIAARFRCHLHHYAKVENQVLSDQGLLLPAGLSYSPCFSFSISTTSQGLFNLVQGVFSLLNSTDPSLTQSCWLCLTAGSPYYEGKASSGIFNNITSHTYCR